MRVMVLGGTVFIGKAIVGALLDAGHDVVVVHRGEHEPPDLTNAVGHIHAERSSFIDLDLPAWRPDAVVDTMAMSRADAELLLSVLPADARLVVLSSMDVYRA